MFKLLMHQILLEFRSEWGSIELKDFGINNNIYLLFISQDCPDLPFIFILLYNAWILLHKTINEELEESNGAIQYFFFKKIISVLNKAL